MEFWITIIGLARRKWVILPAVLIAATFGALAYLATPVRYVSSTTMVVATTMFGSTESRDPSTPTDLTNPMLNFSDSLTTTSAILIGAMNTKEVAAKIGAEGSTKVVVNDGRTNPTLLGLNGPFLYIVGESTSPDEAKRVVLKTQALMREALVDWQSELGAPQKTFVSLVDVVPPSAPESDRGRATKFGLLALIFGFGLTMGTAYFGHQIRARQRARSLAQAPVVGALPLDAISVGDPPGRQDGRPDRGTERSSSPSPILVPDRGQDDSPPAVLQESAMTKVRFRER